jgi:hypothetical protein
MQRAALTRSCPFGKHALACRSRTMPQIPPLRASGPSPRTTTRARAGAVENACRWYGDLGGQDGPGRMGAIAKALWDQDLFRRMQTELLHRVVQGHRPELRSGRV